MNKFKCALIHTPNLCRDNAGNLFSTVNFCAMGLYSLASELKKEGFDAEIIHLGIEKYLNKGFSLSKYIEKEGIKFVAFSLHWHPQSYDVIESARILKESNNDIFIMLGGFSASYFAKEILETYPFIDAIIKGEGEIPIRVLARKVYEKDNDLSDVPNLFYRKNGKVTENAAKFVASDNDLDGFEFFNIKAMKNYESYAKIPFTLRYSLENELNNPMTSQGVCLGRGCLGNCTWCGGGFEAVKKVTGRDFISYRGADEVIGEIKTLKEKCGIEVFRFAFDPNPVPEGRLHLIKLLERIEKEFKGKLTADFTVFSLPDKNFLNAYKKAFSNDSIMSISPEFYSEKLRKLHKSFYFSNAELEDILSYMDKLNIKSQLYFSIIPPVGEDENEKSRRYGEFLQEKFNCVQKYFIVPIIFEPASPWMIEPAKFGIDIAPKKFIDYYNDTKCIEKSFEAIF